MPEARPPRFFAALASPGGHLLLLFLAFLLGILMVTFRLPKGEDVTIGTMGALLALLTGGRGEKTAPLPSTHPTQEPQ